MAQNPVSPCRLISPQTPGRLSLPAFPVPPQSRACSATRSVLCASVPEAPPLSCLLCSGTLEKIDFPCLCCYTLCSPQQRHSMRHLFSHREVGGISTLQTTSKANESCRVMHGSTTMATTIEPLLRYEPPAYLPGLTGTISSLERGFLLFTSCPERDTDISCHGFPSAWRKGKVNMPCGCPEIGRSISRHLLPIQRFAWGD